ncbi:hypothetical protein [Demequina aurantiaca]|uniref:hypothetical protein n=1 Tax=Demequina aurantiaca TaxID=676200 RepID=UPI003D3597C3
MEKSRDEGVFMIGTAGPTVGRLKRPSWRDPRLLIGLVLIAVAVVAVSALTRASDSTAPYFAAKQVLTPGTVLTEADVVVVRVRVPTDVYVSAEGDDAPWGEVVTRVVGEGELLPVAAVAQAKDVDLRAVAVRTATPLAKDIGTGSVVDIWLTQEAAGVPESSLIAQSVVVSQVESDDGAFAVGSGETVYVLVPQADMSDFLGSVATEGAISIVGRAGGGQQ